MFSKILTFKSHHQVIFAVVIVFAVVAVWRGFWGLMDLFGEHFFSEAPFVDFSLSLAIGIAVLWATHFVVKELM